jgi:hypothetical protein
MEKSSRQIRAELKEMWPKLRHIWLFDRNYNVPTFEKIEASAKKIGNYKIMMDDHTIVFNDLYNIGDVWDCDDFSMMASALIRVDWKLKENRLPLPFGRAMGNEFRGMPILHSLNICITQEGVYFIDYDDGGRIWKASPDNDNVFYVSI